MPHSALSHLVLDSLQKNSKKISIKFLMDDNSYCSQDIKTFPSMGIINIKHGSKIYDKIKIMVKIMAFKKT